MTIKDSIKIKDIQKEFNNIFPYLKLEFYKKEHAFQQGSSNADKLDAAKNIGDVRTVHNSGELIIDGNLKVSTLEKRFAETYGLNVQVFRRSKDIWLQTTSTDHWTLSQQNEYGKPI